LQLLDVRRRSSLFRLFQEFLLALSCGEDLQEVSADANQPMVCPALPRHDSKLAKIRGSYILSGRCRSQSNVFPTPCARLVSTVAPRQGAGVLSGWAKNVRAGLQKLRCARFYFHVRIEFANPGLVYYAASVLMALNETTSTF
jgi:hypothetical protein